MILRIPPKAIAILPASRYHASTRFCLPSRLLYQQGNRHSSNTKTSHVGRKTSKSTNPYVADVSSQQIDDSISRIDPYLPLELRSGTWVENLAKFVGVRSPETLLSILKDVRRVFPRGVLSYIGLVQGRWDAVAWLCQALVDFNFTQRSVSGPKLSERYAWTDRDIPFATGVQCEDGKGLWSPVSLKRQNHSSIESADSLEALTGSSFAAQEGQAVNQKLAIGQIWLCLGNAVIEAAKWKWPDRSETMSFVYQQIAKMHSQSLISPALYLFESGEIASSLRKPPLLHLMSSRLMAILSDAMWKVTESQIMGNAAFVAATYAYRGEQMPGSELDPRVRPLGPEIWLEFILWSCVHNGHFQEAADLLMVASEAVITPTWRTIAWTKLQNMLDKELSSLRDRQSAKSWFTRVISTDEGYNQSFPLVSLEKHTISREVVFAISDGLLSTHVALLNKDQVSSPVHLSLEVCKKLLGSAESASESILWNTLLYKTMELSRTVAGLPELVDGSAPLIDSKRENLGDNLQRTSLLKECLEDQTSPRHAMYLRQIEEHVKNGSVRSAFITLQSMYHWADSHHEEITGHSFIKGGPRRRSNKGQITNIGAILPKSSVAQILDLITSSKMYEIGKALLSIYLGDLDSLHKRHGWNLPPPLEAAILRFATVTADKNLQMAVINRNDPGQGKPLDDSLRELVHAQMTACNWVHVGLLLDQMKAERISLTPVDITRAASRLLCIGRGLAHLRERENLRGFMTGALGHLWLPPRDFSQLPDSTPSRELSQLSKVLADVSEEYLGFASEYIQERGVSMGPISLPTEALNILLEAIIANFGSERAQNFAEKWCKFPLKLADLLPESETRVDGGQDTFQPFTPDLQTLRILISPLIVDSLSKTSLLPEAARDGEEDTPNNDPVNGDTDFNIELASLRLHSTSNAEYYEGVIQKMHEAGLLRARDAPYTRIYWALAVCDNLGLDPSGTFQELLTPIQQAHSETVLSIDSQYVPFDRQPEQEVSSEPDPQSADPDFLAEDTSPEGPVAKEQYGGLIVDR